MKKNFAFHKNYFAATVLLFLIELFIALYVKDKFIRPYAGDFLVVILLYCCLKSIWRGTPLKAGLSVLLFAFAVEISQHFQLVELLGLGHSSVARTIIGTGFDWGDLVAYSLGTAVVLGVEKWVLRQDLQVQV